ncbi:MAG: hypothetical protein ACXWLM_12960 [Myxococcales bacterium]
MKWYCDQLSSQANTWTIEADGSCGGVAGSFPVRFDLKTPQPYGGGACALSSWTHGTQTTEAGLGITTYEWCAADLSCTLADGTTASGAFSIFRWDDASQRRAQGQVQGGACEVQLTGTPR